MLTISQKNTIALVLYNRLIDMDECLVLKYEAIANATSATTHANENIYQRHLEQDKSIQVLLITPYIYIYAIRRRTKIGMQILTQSI